jgi:hypothetical protein
MPAAPPRRTSTTREGEGAEHHTGAGDTDHLGHAAAHCGPDDATGACEKAGGRVERWVAAGEVSEPGGGDQEQQRRVDDAEEAPPRPLRNEEGATDSEAGRDHVLSPSEEPAAAVADRRAGWAEDVDQHQQETPGVVRLGTHEGHHAVDGPLEERRSLRLPAVAARSAARRPLCRASGGGGLRARRRRCRGARARAGA